MYLTFGDVNVNQTLSIARIINNFTNSVLTMQVYFCFL